MAAIYTWSLSFLTQLNMEIAGQENTSLELGTFCSNDILVKFHSHQSQIQHIPLWNSNSSNITTSLFHIIPNYALFT